MHSSKHQPARYQPQLFEGLEKGDLARLVSPKLSVDEFKSKMGDDADIIVLSFIVNGKEPATDLMNFIERGYDWVLDADVSSGELDDGEYVVFIEMERDPKAPEQITDLISDINNLTEHKTDEWTFQYHKDPAEYGISVEELAKCIPLTSEAYHIKVGNEEDDSAPEENDFDEELSAMQEAARIPMRKQAPKNDWTESIRVAAGLK
jgi:hypothetical protein